MAKVRFCSRTADLRAKVHDGRDEQARREAVALLREGFASTPFLEFVAELLEPKQRGKGAPKRPPQRWLEIGEEFGWLRDEGVSYEEAMTRLSEKFGGSESTIRRAVDMYEAAVDAARQASAE